MGGVEGGEIIIRTYCMRKENIFFNLKKRRRCDQLSCSLSLGNSAFQYDKNSYKSTGTKQIHLYMLHQRYPKSKIKLSR